MDKNRATLSLKLISVVLSLLILTGCWSKRELDELSIVMSVAIDKSDKDDKKIETTAQIAQTGAVKPQMTGGGSPQKETYWNAKTSADDTFEALRGTTHVSNRKLYMSHNGSVVISKDLAKEGIGDYIDFFLRDQEVRLDIWLIISRGKASDVLDVPSQMEQLPAINISKLAEAQAYNSESSAAQLLDFVKALQSEGCMAPVLPMIEVKGKGDKKELHMGGSAVFNKYKMIGELSEEETRGLMWILKETRSGSLAVESIGGSGSLNVKEDPSNSAVIELLDSKKKITPVKTNDGSFKIKVELEQAGSVASQKGDMDLFKPEELKKVEDAMKTQLEEEINTTIDKAHSLKADIFGFGELIYKKYPKEWKKIKDDWEEIFPSVPVELNIKCKIAGTGRATRTVPIQGE